MYLFGLILVIIQKKYKIELGYDILYFILYLSSFIFIKLIKNKYIDILKKLIPIFAFYFARELKDVRWATNADGSKYEGQWSWGAKCGKGTMTYSSGRKVSQDLGKCCTKTKYKCRNQR